MKGSPEFHLLRNLLRGGKDWMCVELFATLHAYVPAPGEDAGKKEIVFSVGNEKSGKIRIVPNLLPFFIVSW
ncbi:MAG: hypothetical protein WCT30_01050 [Desulfurivibrionaceae bacterium]